MVQARHCCTGLSFWTLLIVHFHCIWRGEAFHQLRFPFTQCLASNRKVVQSNGWVEQNGEWAWEEDDPNYVPPPPVVTATATPQLPSGSYRPKQSLGQNYLKDPNTVSKIIRAFHNDATACNPDFQHIIELGPGAGALTDKLVESYGADRLHVIEIDDRSVDLLRTKHPNLSIQHDDVLQVDYPSLVVDRKQQQQQDDDDDTPHRLVVIGNLPYYITSQILFCLADAAHGGHVGTATVTMQLEVAQRLVAATSTKAYGILSVVFQLYADTTLHFRIPPTVFYPQPKVDSALVGLQFCDMATLAKRLDGVHPADLRQIVLKAFQQRRKTLRKSLKPFLVQVDLEQPVEGLPRAWSTMRPEEITPLQFVALTKHVLGANADDDRRPWGDRVWRKEKHGRGKRPAP